MEDKIAEACVTQEMCIRFLSEHPEEKRPQWKHGRREYDDINSDKSEGVAWIHTVHEMNQRTSGEFHDGLRLAPQ